MFKEVKSSLIRLFKINRQHTKFIVIVLNNIIYIQINKHLNFKVNHYLKLIT